MSVDIHKTSAGDGMSKEELDLYHAIMAYRASLGLAAIPLSTALTTTGNRHVIDTRENIWAEDLKLPKGANLHSWSDAPYFEDGSNPHAMWDAPDRVGTGYTSSGYEIAAAGQPDAEAALDGWKHSPNHNAILTNSGDWADNEFRAIGIGIDSRSGPGPYDGPFYTVWFGEARDAAGPPDIDGGSRGETIDGSDFADRINARGGDDLMHGLSGDDTLVGSVGDDVLSGDAGDDRLEGGSDDDRLYGKSGDDQLLGGDGKDMLSGSSGDDVLNGEAGDDRLDGGTGDDRLYGKTGDDLLLGGDGKDRLSGYDGDDNLRGDSGRDRLDGGSGDDKLYGKTGNDTLAGGSGDDTLSGYSGNDRLTGGRGSDLLSGGAGNDTFVFGSRDASPGGDERIEDFSHGDDRIDLSAIGGLAFIGNDAFSGGADELRYAGGLLAADIDGDRRADLEIALSHSPKLVASDLIL